MDIVRVATPRQVAELLASRPPALGLRLEETQVGRAAFDGLSPEAPFVRAARLADYSAVVRGRGGRPPSYAWMGPGDRWVELVLTANQPESSASLGQRQSFPTPSDVHPVELLARYRAWVDNGEYADCFGDWLRRCRAGLRPTEADQETLFWLNALAAYAGMRDGRASSTDIATAAGLAEDVLDHSDVRQVDFARLIRTMYGLP